MPTLPKFADAVRGAPAAREFSARARAPRRASKTSEIVALEIVRDIVSQGLAPGDRLPLEAEMLAHYRVSRSSLREALRLLEVQGLIAIRPGPGSGTVVGQVLAGNLARTLTLYLHMMGATYDQLLDAWMATEPILARLAASNPDRELRRSMLARFVGSPEDHDHTPIAEGLAFHDSVNELTGNPVLSLVLQAIGSVAGEHILSMPGRSELEGRIVDDHAALAEAIIAGKPDKAAQLMAEHIRHVIDDFRAFWPRRVGEKIQWR
jgi:GntR family transcriptional regulator, transcriptional repressor for pyruvate dehydrogenase complex